MQLQREDARRQYRSAEPFLQGDGAKGADLWTDEPGHAEMDPKAVEVVAGVMSPTKESSLAGGVLPQGTEYSRGVQGSLCWKPPPYFAPFRRVLFFSNGCSSAWCVLTLGDDEGHFAFVLWGRGTYHGVTPHTTLVRICGAFCDL